MMKKHLKRYFPKPAEIKNHRFLKKFGTLFHDPNLWHFSRRSVPGAFAIGLFCAFFPFPGQMVAAALVAIWFRKNIPISVALIWITNPLTIPPIFFLNYKLGAAILGLPPVGFDFEWSLSWLLEKIGLIWLPLFVGSVISATVCAVSGYFLISLIWRYTIVLSHKKRQKKRAQRTINPDS
jgi:uncharacterized protein (DUF2062 family)